MTRELLKAQARSHGDLKSEVMKAVNLIPGVFVFPYHSGGFSMGSRFVQMGMKGVSDLIGWKSIKYSERVGVMYDNEKVIPHFVALEIKVGRDKLSPLQKAFLDQVKAAGGIAAEIRSTEEAVRLLS